MTRSGRTARLPLLAAAGILVLICAAFQMSSNPPSITLTQNSLPTDANPTCVVSSSMLDSWFQSTHASLDGLVNPADSIAFTNPVANCPFYQWSEQMFLWLTSPTTPTSTTRVFRTATFFDVSPQDPTTGARTFIPNPSSGVLNVEQGQADNTVLEAQMTAGGSLVYYLTTFNDVGAFLATGVKAPDPNFPMPAQFPTTPSERDQIVAFASSKGVTIPDPNALVIIVKSSWVLAAGLDPTKYIMITATIPTYDMSNPNHWVPIPTGLQTVQLALIGMHIEGSVTGHSEELWATFEHTDNEPRGTYTYIDNTSSHNVVTVNPLLTANFVFAATNSVGPFNKRRMVLTPASPLQPTIDSISTVPPISASDTKLWKAFGAASNGLPNPLVTSAAASNTEIISINNSVINQLVSLGPDLRSNYVMTGTTWTIGGAAPTCFFQLKCGTPLAQGNIVGTSVLSNATMETSTQGPNTTLPSAGPDGCLTCHRTNGFSVSHDFGNLTPLTSFTTNSGYTLGSFPGNVFIDVPSFGFTPVLADITVVPFGGFTGHVQLSASGLPQGANAFFSQDSTTSKSKLTLAVSPHTPAGHSTVTIKGTSGNLTAFTTVSLTVRGPAANN